MLRTECADPNAGRPLPRLQPAPAASERGASDLPGPDRYGFSLAEAHRHPYRLSLGRGDDFRRLEAPQRSYRPRCVRA